jgi:hypothetical protein
MESVFVTMAEFKMQEGAGKDLVAFFLSPDGLAVTRAYKGCIQFDVVTDRHDPDTVRIYESGKARKPGQVTSNSGSNRVAWIFSKRSWQRPPFSRPVF